MEQGISNPFQGKLGKRRGFSRTPGPTWGVTVSKKIGFMPPSKLGASGRRAAAELDNLDIVHCGVDLRAGPNPLIAE